MKKSKFNLPHFAMIGLYILLLGILGATVLTQIKHYWDTWYSKMTTIVLILTAVYVIVYLLYNLYSRSKTVVTRNNTTIDGSYRCGVFLNVFSLSISVLLIFAFLTASLIKWDPNTVSSETITNFYTAFIALCTTFVVGFQIYNSVDLNKKMDKLDLAKRELEKELEDLNMKMADMDSAKKHLEKQIETLTDINKTCEYFNAYTVGTIRYNEAEMNEKAEPEASKRYCWNAMRAYFNALRLAAIGGQDFEEAWRSFGRNKIYKCLNQLEIIHTNRDYGVEAGDADSVMPTYVDREKFIKQIIGYTIETRTLLVNSDKIPYPLINEYCDLVGKWNRFVKSYYPDIELKK